MLDGIVEQLRQLSDRVGVRAAFGEPVQAHGRTFVPVAKVTYGFGFGGSLRQRHEHEQGEQERDQAEGGGAGAALVVRPVAVVEIRDDRTRVLPVWDANRLALAVLALAAWTVFWVAGSRRPPVRSAAGSQADP
ncbi:MAG: spore germination protein GerW family protein [Armatimonadota bacterium]|nr:spore germination protein GerW family protein [Armatimonadota bacterium]MDW8155084.1 spore germination protein GerW family protein [Armatimonadota bacterium]